MNQFTTSATSPQSRWNLRPVTNADNAVYMEALELLANVPEAQTKGGHALVVDLLAETEQRLRAIIAVEDREIAARAESCHVCGEGPRHA